MNNKKGERFVIDKANEEEYIIYDKEGIDDYYFVGGHKKDIKNLCKLLNKQELKIKELENLKEYKQLKQQNLELQKQLNKIPPKIREIWE